MNTPKSWSALLFLTAAVLGASVRPALGQGFTMGVQAGQRAAEHANGAQGNGYFAGITAVMILGGNADKTTALLFPISADWRISVPEVSEGYSDIDLFGDMALRAGPLSIGGGVAMITSFVPDIADRTIGNDEGKIIVYSPISFGYSGSAKLNMGPQGRFFVQGRFTVLPAGGSFYWHSAEDQQLRSSIGTPYEDVPQRDSYDIRGGLGFVLPSGYVLRAQYILQDWRFERVYQNRTGAFDRQNGLMSVGVQAPLF